MKEKKKIIGYELTQGDYFIEVVKEGLTEEVTLRLRTEKNE